MVTKADIRTLKNRLAKIAQELKGRIPEWIQHISVKRHCSTPEYGIVGKCCHYTEQLFKIALVLMKCRPDPAETRPAPPFDFDKLTLGEACRLMKGQQKEAAVFQGVERSAIGKTFSLLVEIVLLRNKLIHQGLSEGPWPPVKLPRLLRCVYELSDSWLIKKLLDSPDDE